MGLRDWLDAFLGRGPEAETKDEPRDWRLDFLRDICGADAGAVKDYRRLSADAEAACDEIDDAVDHEDDPERFLDAIFLHVCDAEDIATAVDCAEGAEELIDGVDRQLRARGENPLGETARADIVAYVNAKQAKRGEHIGYAFGPLVEQLAQRGFGILDINEGSDCYRFIVAPDALNDRWAGVDLSSGLRLEDPSWQFKKQLMGSPYERFCR